MHSRDKKYKCLIFDFDGTLLDSAASIAESVIEAAKINFLPVPDAVTVKKGIGKSFDNQYVGLFIDGYTSEQAEYSYRVKDKFAVDFRKIYAEQNLSLFLGVNELLESLLRQEYEMAIATNGPRSMLKRMLQHFMLEKYFAITCCGDEFIPKPDPEMLSHVILELGYEAGDAIMIGDSLADIQAAENTNIDSILIANHNLEEISRNCLPSFIIQDIRGIIEIV